MLLSAHLGSSIGIPTITNECPIRSFSQAPRFATYVFLALVGVCIGCGRGGQMSPLSPRFTLDAPERVPVILVGQVLENSHAVAPPQISEWNGRLVQPWTVRVRVEQVLQGEVQPKEVAIFYFSDVGPGESPVARVLGNLYTGHSEVFFLQRDNGKLRTICEGWRTCIMWVRTGTHYNFKTEPGLPIEDNIVRLFLTRGDQTSR
jgi:hypothetical protein